MERTIKNEKILKIVYNKHMNITILKMTDAYEYQSFYKSQKNLIIKDFRELEGTRCYLDDAAKSTITESIKDCPVDGIHFIDSGNYHYLSLLWLSMIDEPFNLVLFDHHPDNQPPSFGSITSCGGWVLESQETLPHLNNVYTYGVGQEIPPKSIPNDLPIYISIDKDVLSTEYAITDWDQGDMTLPTMISMLKDIFHNHKIIGVDICGDSSEEASSGAEINNLTNETLFDFLCANF